MISHWKSILYSYNLYNNLGATPIGKTLLKIGSISSSLRRFDSNMIEYNYVYKERKDLMLKMHKTHQSTNLSTVAVAALVGGLAGAVVGLMFAPKSGKELRQKIYNKADDAIEHVEDVTSHHAGALKQQGTDLVGKGKQLAEDLQTFIQESLKLRKSGYIPIIIKDTPSEESPQTKLEIDPLILVQTEIPLQEE